MDIRRTPWILVAALGASACTQGDDGDPADSTPRAWEDNGFRLNGFRLNGFRLNGFRLNSGVLSGEDGDYVTLDSLTLADETIPIRWIYQGELKGYSAATGVLAGADLVGAKLTFQVEEAGAFRHRMIKIVGVTSPGEGSPAWRYDLLIKDQSGPWEPLCADAFGAPTPAILIEDLWDPATGDRVSPLPSDPVTLACVDAAIGKCAQWGYLPWAEHAGASLAEYHQACTRAVRADYCGDGTSYTLEGTAIHVLDAIGIETEDPGGGYAIEAEWGPDGATCLDPASTRLPGVTVGCELPACGEPFASGGLIQTGSVSPG